MANANQVFVLNSINQSRHFDFDVSILANKIFNTLVNKWLGVVRDTLVPKAKSLLDEEISTEASNKLQNVWLDRLFQHGKVNIILEKFKKTIDEKVLSIPSNFILEEDIDNAALDVNEAKDEEQQLERIRVMRAQIIQLRIEIETLKKLQSSLKST